MVSVDSPPTDPFWKKDPFNFIKPEELESLGIDTADIPAGTFAAHKHPSQLPSRFGGNAYGFGFFEIYDRLKPREIQLLQSISFENQDDIKKHYEKINQIYKKIGLLIRFSKQGQPYYLIPVHLVSNTLIHIQSKVDEVTKIINFHRKKYFKEHHDIGLVTNTDDFIIHELSLHFKEHRFVVLDSLEEMKNQNQTLDLVIITRDLYDISLMEKFSLLSLETSSKMRLDQYAIYILGKIYNLLKPDGEIYIIANRYPIKTNQQVKVAFKTVQEKKNFTLFSHVFKTKKRYRIKGRSIQVNIFDLQRYLSGLYVEQEIMGGLLGERDLDEMTLEDINNLPYLNLPLNDTLVYDQEQYWPRLLRIYFDTLFLKPVIPESIKAEWDGRFSSSNYSPDYMLSYLGQKKPLVTTLNDLKKDVSDSRLSGCLLPLLADYRDSFDYLIRTLTVLNNIKRGDYTGLPEIFMERLRQPLENKRERFSGLNDVLKLMSKVKRLEGIKSYLNPDMIEGTETDILNNLPILPFFGFGYGELKEICLIIMGHTTMGRILSGKMIEKTLKPVSDLARSYSDPRQALNLLRYCRLMSVAEMVASKKTDLNQEQLAELFDLFDSVVRVVTNREMDWDQLLDEEISSMEGIHDKIIRKILKMMNHFQFLDNWSELRDKGEMEKESLADYDEKELAKIDNTIKLVGIIEEFEDKFLKDDPLQLPTLYRKFLNMEFHGTGHIFERMDSQLVFILLWVAVNVTRGEVINFNPILANVDSKEIDSRIKKVEGEAKFINHDHLDMATLEQLSEQLYENDSSFIIGTGFQLKVNNKTQAVDITYLDVDEDIEELEILIKKTIGCKISEVPIDELEELERLFANLVSFRQSHLRLISRGDFRLPARQKTWFEKAKGLEECLKSSLIKTLFSPEDIYVDLNLLYHHSPTILSFILPEIMSLQDLKISGHIYLKSSPIDYIFSCIRKIQSLIRHDREGFHDIQLSHKLAQREFGPMAAGIVGVSEFQIEQLEAITEHLRHKSHLFDALVKSFIFQDIGRIPTLRGKYEDEINPADYAQASAVFLEKEEIPLRYHSDREAQFNLISLVRYHDFILHIIRGEYSPYAMQEILNFHDNDLFDALFLNSFIMLSAMREDLILEDLAAWLFHIRAVSHRIFRSEITLEDYFEEIHIQNGQLFYALEEYHRKGLPDGISPARYLESFESEESERERYIEAGKMIFAMERIFRLKGIRYVEFIDLANLTIKVPLKYIYKEKRYSSIGYASFERELYEILRIYNGIQRLPESTRHFIFQRLVKDEVRIYGFENVGAYLNYENLIKLILIDLLGSQKFKKNQQPICLAFLNMAEKIDIRYEAVNDWLNNISIEKIWEDRSQIDHFFKTKTGILLKKDESQRVLFIDFVDRVNIPKKISYMQTINDVEQIKNYFHYSLQSLRKIPFYTDDYELELEKAFEKRLREITDLMLDQAKKQMELLKDFSEIHYLFTDLMNRSLEIGFTDDQKHKLTDIYEFRKDQLKREKLNEINGLLETIHDVHELKDYWDSVKWYLFHNRPFLGEEFENLLAKNFDEVRDKIAEG